MKIGIVGSEGHVGQAMKELFPQAVCLDLNQGSKEEINQCHTVFVCVPTPSREDGSCNTDIVESVLAWLDVPLIILRSTVYVGFTEAMMAKYQKEIVFQPEYYGETVDHPFRDLSARTWLTFGGTDQGIHLAIRTYQSVYNSNVIIRRGDARSIELCKYMENCFLATKVTFCNEMKDLADALGADYDVAREAWIADPRIGSSHTFVYDDDRGFGGSCLPKDLASLIHQAEEVGADATLLKSIREKNKKYRKNG